MAQDAYALVCLKTVNSIFTLNVHFWLGWLFGLDPRILNLKGFGSDLVYLCDVLNKVNGQVSTNSSRAQLHNGNENGENVASLNVVEENVFRNIIITSIFLSFQGDMEGVLVYDTDGILVWEETSGRSTTLI